MCAKLRTLPRLETWLNKSRNPCAVARNNGISDLIFTFLFFGAVFYTI